MDKKPRAAVLITRPLADSRQLAASLESFSIAAHIAPVLEIEYLPHALRAHVNRPWQGIAVTSHHALESLKHYPQLYATPLYCVGETTTATALEYGFSGAVFAGLNAAELSAWLNTHVHGTTLLYPSADHVHTHLHGGFTVQQVVVYRSSAVKTLPDAVQAMLRSGEITGVALFSRRSAEIFTDLWCECSNLEAICISDAVAAVAARTRWRIICVAEAPNAPSMIKKIRESPSFHV